MAEMETQIHIFIMPKLSKIVLYEAQWSPQNVGYNCRLADRITFPLE